MGVGTHIVRNIVHWAPFAPEFISVAGSRQVSFFGSTESRAARDVLVAAGHSKRWQRVLYGENSPKSAGVCLRHSAGELAKRNSAKTNRTVQGQGTHHATRACRLACYSSAQRGQRKTQRNSAKHSATAQQRKHAPRKQPGRVVWPATVAHRGVRTGSSCG